MSVCGTESAQMPGRPAGMPACRDAHHSTHAGTSGMLGAVTRLCHGVMCDEAHALSGVSLHGDRAGADHVDQGFDGDGNDTPAARHYIRSRIRTILPTADPEPIGLALRNR